eukprot:TRINITY_DN30143_c0_g3_i2.p1 TRINITY_DN30143_c0_g3~~TRINITY_DN30143_c0_g3_i2.p1  ORF type:complete len:1077 (+),score=239.23 TRINITY_DN30143_c0_g3_i2:351-3233(+)
MGAPHRPSSALSAPASPAPRHGGVPPSTPGPAGPSGELALSTSSRAPLTVSSPAKRHAQHDLTQKLRAMDLALERIERENAGLSDAAGMGGSVQLRRSVKENVDPQADMSASSAAPADASGMHLSPYPRSPQGIVTATSLTAPVATATANMTREHSPSQGLGLAALEAAWREAHSALRLEVSRELSALRENLREREEDRKRSSVQLLTDFEVELTSALEARAKESDGLLEKKLIEATETLQRQFSGLEASLKEASEKTWGPDGETQRRLAELEASARSTGSRLAETGQSCGEALQVAKEQLATFRQRIQHVQDEGSEAKEQLGVLKQRVQQLMDEREENREQLASFRLRLQNFQDGSDKEQVGCLRQQLQQARDGASYQEATLKRMEDGLATRVNEIESGLSADHRALDSRVHELHRCVEDLQHRILLDIGDLREHRDSRASAAQDGAERCEELRRFCDLEVAALRGRLDACEHRWAEEAQSLRRGLEGSDAHSARLVEASVASHVEALRTEQEQERRGLMQRLDQVAAQCTQAVQDARSTAREATKDLLTMEVDRQLSKQQDDRCAITSKVDALNEKQLRQQKLIEDLLAAAARRSEASGSLGVDIAIPYRGGDMYRGAAAEISERFSGRIESLGARVAALEESSWAGNPMCGRRSSSFDGGDAKTVASTALELAERCGGKIEQLTARVAAVEEQTMASAGSATEAKEALCAWPRRLESLSTRLEGGRTELRAELRAAEQESARQAAQLKALSAREDEGQAERRALERQLALHAENISAASALAATAEAAAAEASAEAQSLRHSAEAAESSSSDTVGRRASVARHMSDETNATMVRLEARVELGEARNRVGLSEVRARVEELGKRVQQSWQDSDLSTCSGIEPWAPQLRSLERELKALLAAQVEDSAAALRSVAALVDASAQQDRDNRVRDLHDEPSMVHRAGSRAYRVIARFFLCPRP